MKMCVCGGGGGGGGKELEQSFRRTGIISKEKAEGRVERDYKRGE